MWPDHHEKWFLHKLLGIGIILFGNRVGKVSKTIIIHKEKMASFCCPNIVIALKIVGPVSFFFCVNQLFAIVKSEGYGFAIDVRKQIPFCLFKTCCSQSLHTIESGVFGFFKGDAVRMVIPKTGLDNGNEGDGMTAVINEFA